MWFYRKVKRWVMRLKGWRTIAINLIATVMPLLEMTEITNIMPDSYVPFYAIGLAAVNLYLRTITTTPIGEL